MKQDAKERILIVEDDTHLLKVYDRLLSSQGYEVTTASTGEKALETAQEQRPALVLMDVVLPDISGLETMEKLRQKEETRNIYIVLISAEITAPEKQADALDAGADGYLLKPINNKELVSRIDAFIRHKRSMDAIQEREHQLEKIIRKNADGILVIDPEGVIQFANPAAAQLFSKDHTQLTGKEFGYPFVTGENTEIEVLHKGKMPLTVEMRVVPIVWHDREMTLASLREITERKKMEETLRVKNEEIELQNQQFINLNDQLIKSLNKIETINKQLEVERNRARESDQLKSHFLANMSHEIRTPMNAIIGFSNLLAEDNLPAKKQKRYLRIIQTRSEHLLQLINDILDISKIESNQITMVQSPFSLNQLFHEVDLVYREILMQKKKENIDFRVETGLPDGQDIIISDPDRMRQVLNNLLNNAIKFTDTGSIEAGYTLRDEQSLVFYVRDTGIGIPGHLHDSIFHRFRKAEEGFTKTRDGTGLGLSIVKNLIELMGGTIWLESDPGQGSTFYFTHEYNPAAGKMKAPAAQEEGKTPDWKSHTVLVAEDDPVNLMYLEDILQKTGLKVLSAYNGRECLDVLAKHPETDLVLMDLKMPVMDGFQAAGKIKENRKDLPVIAQTAYAMEGDHEKAVQAGCTDYIAKPIIRDELYRIIGKYL